MTRPSSARICAISGPVLHARPLGPFVLREAIEVGPRRLLGEVIRVARDEIVAQVYEDTTGLKPGDSVEGTGSPLSVALGPRLLGRMFDGLLRPLSADDSLPELHFEPEAQVGARLAAGAAWARVHAHGGPAQRAVLPPDVSGIVIGIAAAGVVTDTAPLLQLRGDDGEVREITLVHRWPVRKPRPVAARLPSNEPLVTGQRVLDALFPIALGGKGAIPGGFGTGKTILLESLAKGSRADVIVYLGCGERGNEMAGVLEEFPQLQDPRSGRPLMERTVIIANTSNMPVAAREASIYSAVTVAEYFRDQGLHVALMADSTSRWAEALREVSGRFGELPGEGGYPTYLASRLADFYERAAKVRTLGGDIGSVTILGSISPPSGDFSEPVTSHTKRYVRCYWALDAKRAQARFYPAVDPLQSYSEDAGELASWWFDRFADVSTGRGRRASGENEWVELRRKFLTLLDEQARLERMARIIGKDALPPRQRLTLVAAELFNEAFLRQSAFSTTDRTCSPERQARMMRVLAQFIELAEHAADNGVSPERIAALPVMRTLARMCEDIGDDALDCFDSLVTALQNDFAALEPAEASQ